MFDHSIKVPRLYKTAAKIYQRVKEGNGSVKQLVYEKKHPNIKALYALVVETIHMEKEINNLIKRSEILNKEERFDPWLAKILITELLFGKKRLPGESKPIKTVLAYEQILKAHQNEKYVPELSQIGQVEKPRYVRINTLQCSLMEAIDNFAEEGWVLTKHLDNTNYDGFLEKLVLLNENEFLPDIHIPNLLIFPSKTQFYRHPGYKNGSIILQDKASCLPVHILAPPPGSVVLDMCAAPGMKTTQLAAVLNNEGTVYACERDERRFKTLENITAASGATCIKCINKDILTCDSETFPNVEYILVDPSCTGSGITDRLELEVQQNENRLSKLAGFQIKILRTALTRYPNVKRVVYSTCSIHPEENEDVVRQVLETNTTFKLVPAKKFVNDTWNNFGSEQYGDIGRFCLYAKQELDLTNGFFVAVFERLEEGEENQFFNRKIYNFKRHEQDRKRRELTDNNYDAPDNYNRKRKKNNYNLQQEEGYDNSQIKMRAENEDNYEDEPNYYNEPDNNRKTNENNNSLKQEKKTLQVEMPTENEENYDEPKPKKKKKKHKDEESVDTLGKDMEMNFENNTNEISESRPKTKKKKRKDDSFIENNSEDTDKLKKKKKKKEKSIEVGETDENISIDYEEMPIKKKKKKAKKEKAETEEISIEEQIVHKKEKKKKKHKEREIA